MNLATGNDRVAPGQQRQERVANMLTRLSALDAEAAQAGNNPFGFTLASEHTEFWSKVTQKGPGGVR